MSYYNHYKTRPAAKNKSAQIAWDELQDQAQDQQPPKKLVHLWFAPEMQAWCAELDDGEFIEIDMLEVSDRRNNPRNFVAPQSAPAASGTKGPPEKPAT